MNPYRQSPPVIVRGVKPWWYRIGVLLYPRVSRWRWFRRWHGGHWERWFVSPWESYDGFFVWLLFRDCSSTVPAWPVPLNVNIRGPYECEDWPGRKTRLRVSWKGKDNE